MERLENNPKKRLEELTEKALAGRGFVVFFGVLSDKKDKDGNYTINFYYNRDRFCFEDLPKAIAAFKTHCQNDAVRILD